MTSIRRPSNSEDREYLSGWRNFASGRLASRDETRAELASTLAPQPRHSISVRHGQHLTQTIRVSFVSAQMVELTIDEKSL